ncbi:MAG TPA: methyltransferase domain-containing protein [Arenimonas sp.]|uniref:methyltransferase domain-containing protein n=1 Tax=Arenimonas sp. TaxID=1872635 RepID=UPI002BB76054|nr:methyltransferase domain-containing protein [Arenimonas sp.]HMB57868.1 methyltransferase domain-containing protein [Arenimonas sp.]
MPSARARRQPENRPADWFGWGPGRTLVGEAQRQTIPELTRVFGHTGLYLRPSAESSPELSGNMLARVLSLHRVAGGFDGVFRCEDGQLPLAADSLSLLCSLFVLETSANAPALMREVARVLKPEGIALFISLNPWSPTRLRWALHAGVPRTANAVETLVRDAGLEVIRRRYVGPRWAKTQVTAAGPFAAPRLEWFDGLRAASLVIARRREAPLTLQRKPMPAVGMRPGMSVG